MASFFGFKTICIGWLLAHSAYVAADLVTYTSKGRPYCNSAKSDPDGDGFGYEKRTSCIVRGGRVDPSKDPNQCAAGTGTTSLCDSQAGLDPLAAGIGEFIAQLGKPVPLTDTLKTTPGGTPYCTSMAIDPDEDGFGWENSRSCVVRFSGKDPQRGSVRGCTIQVTTYPYCQYAQNGWSFEQGRACVAINYCPTNRDTSSFESKKLRNVLMQNKAQKSTRTVYDFLRSIYGQYTISGQMDKVEVDSFDMARRVYDETGKWPGVMGYDFMNYTRPGKINSVPGGRQQVEEAIAYWQRGGLVTFLWHWRDPLAKTDHFYTDRTSAKIPIDRQGRLDRRDPTMAAIDADIAVVAAGLQRLQAAGVTVLWRPLHEAAGGWFWWGRTRTDGIAAPYAQVVLWRYLYTELTQRYGLNNLIWVWNGQHAGWYPGDEYVDIVGFDVYPERYNNGSQSKKYQVTAAMPQYPKMVAMTENGNLPDPDWLDADNANWLWFMTWNDFHPVGTTHKTNFWSGEFYNTAAHKRHVYNHSRVLTLEDLQHIDFTTPAKD